MKNTKQSPIGPNTPDSSEPEVASPPRIAPSGRTQVSSDFVINTSVTSKTSMTPAFLGFDAIYNRIRARGFIVPTITFQPRAMEKIGRDLVFPTLITTLMEPDDLAYTWLKRFEARATESGGVAAIKARLKFNPEAIRRWMQLKK